MSQAPSGEPPNTSDIDDGLRVDDSGDHAVPRAISSEALLNGATQLAIRHHQTIYFLRQTRFGKLILTK
jgi:hemin uptake protein HemP